MTTKTAQFTPGPWEHRGNRVYRKDSYEVAWIAGDGPHSEWQANGKLIAAAPAMYEALKAMIVEWDRHGCCDSRDVVYKAERAIAQAEGR